MNKSEIDDLSLRLRLKQPKRSDCADAREYWQRWDTWMACVRAVADAVSASTSGFDRKKFYIHSGAPC